MKTLLKSMPWLGLMALAVMSVPRSASTAPPPPERHPHIRAAIRELREARLEMQRADRDFCGHRAGAVKEADEAIRQLQEALDCDRK